MASVSSEKIEIASDAPQESELTSLNATSSSMSDAATKKLAEEIARLELDLKTLEASCTTSEAAKKIAEYCQSTADPFLGENDSGPNPWQQSGQGGGSCSIL